MERAATAEIVEQRLVNVRFTPESVQAHPAWQVYTYIRTASRRLLEEDRLREFLAEPIWAEMWDSKTARVVS